MWLILGIIILVLWVLGAFVMKIVSGLIHLLVIVAIAAIILHFVRKKRIT